MSMDEYEMSSCRNAMKSTSVVGRRWNGHEWFGQICGILCCGRWCVMWGVCIIIFFFFILSNTLPMDITIISFERALKKLFRTFQYTADILWFGINGLGIFITYRANALAPPSRPTSPEVVNFRHEKEKKK